MDSPTPTKEQILALLNSWVSQRSGIDAREYGQGRDFDRESFMGDYRPMLKDGQTARKFLEKIQWSDMTAETLIQGFSAFSGRLQIQPLEGKPGEFRIEYCTGQYFPTEYRAAACAVMASALWSHYREDSDTGETMRAKFRRMFGRGIASRWFK